MLTIATTHQPTKAPPANRVAESTRDLGYVWAVSVPDMSEVHAKTSTVPEAALVGVPSVSSMHLRFLRPLPSLAAFACRRRP